MRKNKISGIALVILFLTSTIGVVDGAVNLISNPGFELGTSSWTFYSNAGYSFNIVSPGYEGNNAAMIKLIGIGTNMQLYQNPVSMEPNTRYRLSFAANSTYGGDMIVRLFKHTTGTPYAPDFKANLSTNWQTNSTEFTSSSSAMNDARLMFWFVNVGARAGEAYYIDNVRLEKVSPDTSPPIVTDKTPTGTGVPVTTQITVIFNESMNQASAQTAFSISPSTTMGNFGWSGENMMTYTPGSSLSAGTTYTVIIGNGAKDLAGNSLQSPYSWQFTTASVSDTSPPIVTDKTPTGTDVPVTTQIAVTFNESMNANSVIAAFSASPAISGMLSVSGGNTFTLTPSPSISAGTTYTITIGTGAKDLAGNSLQSPYSWSFTTSGGSSSIEERLAALEADMTAIKTRVTTLETENTALKNLLAGVSRNGDNIYIDGANLNIRDGSGSTGGPVNGLGNMIIGYNELRGSGDNRTGSHNLILGSKNNYTSYGGLVAGTLNNILAPYASVSGGYYNTASGGYSSVSGGITNTASSTSSSVSGGRNNTAGNYYSSVSGGYSRRASGQYDWVAGDLFQDQ